MSELSDVVAKTSAELIKDLAKDSTAFIKLSGSSAFNKISVHFDFPFKKFNDRNYKKNCLKSKLF